MKKLIVMYLGIALIREVAKYYKINSFADIMKMVLPSLDEILPNGKSKTKELQYS
ncbi:MAG: hypothetical protein HYX39_03670 [Bacteroidetes bacterium]|nr:hypothetical protein [Bacteroidota bacterium]